MITLLIDNNDKLYLLLLCLLKNVFQKFYFFKNIIKKSFITISISNLIQICIYINLLKLNLAHFDIENF